MARLRAAPLLCRSSASPQNVAGARAHSSSSAHSTAPVAAASQASDTVAEDFAAAMNGAVADAAAASEQETIWASSDVHHLTTTATSAEEQIQAYSIWAQSYDDEMQANDLHSFISVTQKSLEFWAEASPEDPASTKLRVLDAGCGTGLLGAYFRNHADTTANVHLSGLDLCPDMLKVAETKKCYDALKPGNLKELLPFPAASFDQIISTGVFQPGHVGPEVIPNILSLLKPRGFFITTVRGTMFEAEGAAFRRAIKAGAAELLEADIMPYYGEIEANVLVISKK